VRLAETKGCELGALPSSAFADAHRLFGKDVTDALDPVKSLEHRDVEGGTGPAALHSQLESARAAIRL
jgi:argininosuccinate lyase